MSQKKVDEYKKYKANRKAILAREKKMRKVRKVLGIFAAIVVIAGFGCWGVHTYQVETAPDYNFYGLITQNEYGVLSPQLVEETATTTAE